MLLHPNAWFPILQKSMADGNLKKMVPHHRELRSPALECLNSAFGQVAQFPFLYYLCLPHGWPLSQRTWLPSKQSFPHSIIAIASELKVHFLPPYCKIIINVIGECTSGFGTDVWDAASGLVAWKSGQYYRLWINIDQTTKNTSCTNMLHLIHFEIIW